MTPGRAEPRSERNPGPIRVSNREVAHHRPITHLNMDESEVKVKPSKYMKHF